MTNGAVCNDIGDFVGHPKFCIITINVLWLFLTVPWAGLYFVIVQFPDHTHLFLKKLIKNPNDGQAQLAFENAEI